MSDNLGDKFLLGVLVVIVTTAVILLVGFIGGMITSATYDTQCRARGYDSSTMLMLWDSPYQAYCVKDTKTYAPVEVK